MNTDIFSNRPAVHRPTHLPQLAKAPTGIAGFDEITLGGLPNGRPTLICGAAGSGKTLFAATFLLNGAVQYDEPGVFVSFEERSEDLAANVASLGYDLEKLVEQGKIVVDYVRVERSEIEEAGEYDLEGLFVRLGFAVDSVGAKRVVLDTIETLFAGLTDTAVLRSELRRLFGWIKERGLTAIITGERGDGQFTRQGLEEYVSDCVILLDNRVTDQITTRRLRVVKYRGSAHGTNEYPFLIDDAGISVLPVTSASLYHGVSDEIVSTGVPGLDAMFGAGGYYRGGSLMISGEAGTGKTTLGSFFIDAACRRGERCLFFVFEESPEQICRNARSVGLDLQRHVESGLLTFVAARPSLHGLEMHLAGMHRDVLRYKPDVVVVDPITSFRGPEMEVHATLLRMIDMLKSRIITALFTSLRGNDGSESGGHLGLSSLMDGWIKLEATECDGEINRTLFLMKARGMSHSNQIREYLITGKGIDLVTPYIGRAGVLTGSARINRQAKEQADAIRQKEAAAQRQREITRKRTALERRIAEMQDDMTAEEDELRVLASEEEHRLAMLDDEQGKMATRRGALE